MIIFSKKNHLEKFYFYNNLDKNFTIAINNMKYNNDKLNFY